MICHFLFVVFLYLGVNLFDTFQCADVLLSAVSSSPLTSVRHSDTERSYVSGAWLDTYLPAYSSTATVHLPAILLGKSGVTTVLVPFAVHRGLSFDFILGLDVRAYYHETYPLRKSFLRLLFCFCDCLF